MTLQDHHGDSMHASLDTLTQAALALPVGDRTLLAQRLFDSLHANTDPNIEAAWEEEIIRRIAQMDAGESKPIPAAEVFAELRRIAPDRP